MTIVYGGCIEPGGMELDNDTYETECPMCKDTRAIKRHWQACEGGSINTYWSLVCDACGWMDGVSDEYYED